MRLSLAVRGIVTVAALIWLATAYFMGLPVSVSWLRPLGIVASVVCYSQ